MNKLNDIKRYFTKRNIILAVFSILMVAGLICSNTLSKYTSKEQIEAEEYLEQFHAVARLYYIKDGETKKSEAQIGEDGYIQLTPTEFETISVDVEYTGKAKTYCRFRLDCSWLHKNSETYIDDNGVTVTKEYLEIVPHQYTKYTCGDKIYNNIEKDGYFYFTEVLEADNNTTETYNVIKGVRSDGDDVQDLVDPDHDHSKRVRIIMTVDCVQYNRVSELWKINTLPWWD